ncbi:MAG: hypothetical protein ABL876_10290, partial [Chitinophagaceae bacterium]
MLDKIAIIKNGAQYPIPHSKEDVQIKLDYYRSLFGKTHDLSEHEFEKLKQDIITFFNVKAVSPIKIPPPKLVRVSNNTQILKSKGRDLSYLTEIPELLAPPLKSCCYNRCNLLNQQVLYCSTNQAAAYWETKPKKGDVITLSLFELKPNVSINCGVIKKEKTKDPKIQHRLQELFYQVEEFNIDAFSFEVDKSRQRNYIFSAIISSELLFPTQRMADNLEAIIYPSVQKKKYDENFAIKNDVIFDYYNLVGVETRFILDEFDDVDPSSDELITDNLIGAFYTKTFDLSQGKILYNSDADKLFKLYRELQTSEGKQVRFNPSPNVPKTLSFNCSANIIPTPLPPPYKFNPNT